MTTKNAVPEMVEEFHYFASILGDTAAIFRIAQAYRIKVSSVHKALCRAGVQARMDRRSA